MQIDDIEILGADESLYLPLHYAFAEQGEPEPPTQEQGDSWMARDERAYQTHKNTSWFRHLTERLKNKNQ